MKGYPMISNRRSAGYTLLELVMASAMFAVLMLMTNLIMRSALVTK